MKKFINNKFKLNGQFVSSRFHYSWFVNNGFETEYNTIFEMTKYLNEQYINLKSDHSIKQRILDILNDELFLHKCSCGKPVKLTSNLYSTYCGDLECLAKINSAGSKKALETRIKNNGGKPIKQTAENIQKRIETRRRNGKPWHTEESKRKISETNSKTWLNIWADPTLKQEYKQKYLEERKTKHSQTMKKLIKSGKFTPNITNSWANSRCKLTLNTYEKFYRSSWDAAFQILNPTCKYEELRIPYIDTNGKQRIYITDFIDEDLRILYEIKPLACIENKINKLKENAAKDWCIKNDYIYQLITDEYFKKYAKLINFKKYDQKIFKGMKQFL